MLRKALVCAGVMVFVIGLAASGFAAGGGGMKGTVSKIEGDQVTITLDSKGQASLKEGDKVTLSAGKAKKNGGTKSKGGKTGLDNTGMSPGGGGTGRQ